MNLCVAGLPLCIISADTDFFDKRFAEYACEETCTPQMHVVTMRCDHIEQPDGELIAQIERVTVVRLPDGRVCRYGRAKRQDGSDGAVLFSITNTAEYSDVEIRLLKTRRHPTLSLTDYEYMYTGAAFQNRLAVLGGGVLHSSAIAYHGQGVAFSAPSGTGKSTHTALWQECFGDAVEMLNDDKPAIYFDGDKPIICGTPWSGKTDHNHNRCVPLRAIVFIERGTKNRIERLDTVDSMFYLTGQIARPYYDEALGICLLDFIERILVAVPIYRLTCDISRQAVETAFHALFPEEE